MRTDQSIIESFKNCAAPQNTFPERPLNPQDGFHIIYAEMQEQLCRSMSEVVFGMVYDGRGKKDIKERHIGLRVQGKTEFDQIIVDMEFDDDFLRDAFLQFDKALRTAAPKADIQTALSKEKNVFTVTYNPDDLFGALETIIEDKFSDNDTLQGRMKLIPHLNERMIAYRFGMKPS